MKLGNDMYCNTGGNCMVMYVNVLDGGEVKQFACTDEMVGAFDGADMADEEIELWWVEGREQLVYRVGEDIANQLQERFLKHESDAQWFRQVESKLHGELKMKLTTDKYYNTGGGCFAMFVDVVDGGEILQIACNEEIVVGLTDLEENISAWYAYDYKELVKHVGEEIAKELHVRYLKYDTLALWLPHDNTKPIIPEVVHESKLHYHVKEHPYFLSEVEITIEPRAKYHVTDCEIKFSPNGQDGGLDYPSTWWVSLDGYFTDAKDALAEATKEKYTNSGVSEA